MSVAVVASVRPAGEAQLRAAAAAAAPDADLLEVRLDRAGRDFDRFLALLPELPLPVIVTVRRREEGGTFEGSEAERGALLEAAAQRAAWIDVEARSELSQRPLGPARRIVSWHDFAAPPPDPLALARELAARHPDATIKLAANARDLADVAALARAQRACADAGLRVALFGLGELALPTRLLAGKLGAALVYGSIEGHEPTAPCQPTVALLSRLHRVRSQSRATLAGAIVGDPVAHSLSPLLHSTLARVDAIDRAFVPLRASALEGALAACDALAIDGCSVTLPHKETAARVAVGPLPGEPWPPPSGAVNTLLRSPEGWRAANTDRLGLLAALATVAPARLATLRRALVLGAGGAAATAVSALRERSLAVTIASRTRARADALAARFGVQSIAWDERATAARDLIVNATPLGMAPAVDATPFPAAALRTSDLVFDLVYRPRLTRLLRDAADAGATTLDGVEMFLQQGLAQHQRFTGSPASPAAVAAARAALAEALGC